MARVLWLAKGLGRGGAEHLLLGSVPYVDRTRFEVEVAYLLPWKDALVADFEAAGVRVHCLGNRNPLDPRWASRLRRIVRDGRFDLVHTHAPYPAVGARLALGRRAPAIVHTEHNLWRRYRLATRWANRLTYRRNAAVLAVSDAVAASIGAPGQPPRGPGVEVIHHGADLRAVRRDPGARERGRAKLGIDTEAQVVGTVGNFTAKKDHRAMLAAVALAAAEDPRLHLVMVGTGPREAEVREAARDLGLDGRVTFTGSRADVFDLLPAFDVFTLSSRHEGLPIALLEAMASGVPCVATRVGGVPEVITDGREGFLVPPGDAGALAAALGKLLEDPRLRTDMASRAAERATDFDLARAVERTQTVYERVLSLR